MTNEYKKQFTISNPTNTTQKLFEKIISEISDKLKSIEVNDEMQPDYFFAIDGIIQGLEIIDQNIKINDDLRLKINNYVSNVNPYEIITESNLNNYKIVDQISQCITAISLDITLYNNPDADEKVQENAKNKINENYQKLKTLITSNSLEKDSPLKQLLEEIIEFVKELFNVPPFTFKFTAFHQQQPPLAIEIPKNCAQELKKNKANTNPGNLSQYIN